MNTLSYSDILIRLLAAAVLGSIIGFEPERLLWAAGIRTHMVVYVGACLIMIVSAFGFRDSLSSQNVVLDPSRVAAQVVSGIGFLGAGAILARGEIVRGLTTAASIWTVAAIGLAVGGGLYFAAGVSTAVIVVIVAGEKPLEEAYRARNQSCRLKIESRPWCVNAGPLETDARCPHRSDQAISRRASGRHRGNHRATDINTYVTKLNELDWVNAAKVIDRKRGEQS